MKHPWEEMLQRQQQQERQAERDGQVPWWEFIVWPLVIVGGFLLVVGSGQ